MPDVVPAKLTALRNGTVTMGNSTKPDEKEHLEDVGLKHQEETLQDHEEIDINDVAENKRLNRRLDIRVLPLCCWVYLLNFLDRGTLMFHIIVHANDRLIDSFQATLAMREY